MSQIPLKETYTPTLVYDDPNNPQAARTVTYWTSYTFESSTLAVSANAGNYDGSPLPDYSVVGEFYWDCAGTVRQSYVHDGHGGYNVAPEADSLSCGYVPASPLTCDLVLAPVVLTDTVAGTTAQAVVTTAHGRVHYRLDGGAEQLSPYFYNVAPGAHLLAVRDDGVANCRRSRSFTVAAASPPAVPPGAPAGLDFVGQPLWCSVPAPAGAEVLVELWAETAHGAEDFGRVFVSRKQASLTGGVSTRLDTLLWPLLKAFVPAATAVATATQVCRTNLLNYFVRTVVLVPGRAAAYQTLPLRTAVRGALPAEWRGLDYFAYRLDAYGPPPFLSWQPAGKRITAEQPEWLFWLCPSSQPPVLTVRRSYVRTGFAGGAPLVEDEAVNLNAGRGPKGRLLAIPVKPRAGTDAVSVALFDPAGEALSPLVSYAMVPATAKSRYVLFTNSLGGCDTLRTEGRLDSLLEATTTVVERPAQVGDRAPAPDRLTTEVLAARKLKLATGWLRAAELEWLQDLVLAREIWLVHARLGLLPLLLAKRSLSPAADDGPLRGMQLEFDYAFAPTAYARL